MKVNPIEELRHMEAPVSEQEWEWASIVNDSRYVQKFGKKPKISPKGRAALVAGIAAVLITVPILVKTLSHKEKMTSPTTPAPVETNVPQTTESTVSPTVAPKTTAASAPTVPESHTNTAPAKVAVTDQSANNERSTMVDVIAKRQQATINQAINETIPQTDPKQPTTRDNIKSTPEQAGQVITTNDTKPTPSRPAKHINTNDDNEDAQMTVAEESLRSNPMEEEPVTADEFYIPSAFTPNGDGLNDIFYVSANFEPKSYEIYIYNRGGELMFTARDMLIGWDGKLHGHTLAQGVYVYLIKYKDRNGNEKREQGQVLLIP